MSETPRTDKAMTWSHDLGRLVVNAEIAQKIETELSEARAEIERLKRENIELLVKCDEKFDVIDRKDKLIEQMLEALGWVKGVSSSLPSFFFDAGEDKDGNERESIYECVDAAIKVAKGASDEQV